MRRRLSGRLPTRRIRRCISGLGPPRASRRRCLSSTGHITSVLFAGLAAFPDATCFRTACSIKAQDLFQNGETRYQFQDRGLSPVRGRFQMPHAAVSTENDRVLSERQYGWKGRADRSRRQLMSTEMLEGDRTDGRAGCPGLAIKPASSTGGPARHEGGREVRGLVLPQAFTSGAATDGPATANHTWPPAPSVSVALRGKRAIAPPESPCGFWWGTRRAAVYPESACSAWLVCPPSLSAAMFKSSIRRLLTRTSPLRSRRLSVMQIHWRDAPTMFASCSWLK